MSKNCPIMQRIKSNYESRSQTHLTRRIPVIIRIDGKAFHTYTKGLNKPFDDGLMDDMDSTAIHLCQNIQGAKCAYVQSDEISILITDYDTLQTDAWFDYNVQKICSISASLATGVFNYLRIKRLFGSTIGTFVKDPIYTKEYVVSMPFETFDNFILASFDSRTFNIPKEEVANYFLARQKDAVKNSIASVAQSLYSPKELHGKNGNQQQELIFQKGVNWNDFSVGEKRGRFIVKNTYINDELCKVYPDYIIGATEDFNKLEFYPKNCREDITEDKCRRYVPTYEEGSGFRDHFEDVEIEKIRTKWEVVKTPLTFNEQNFEQWL